MTTLNPCPYGRKPPGTWHVVARVKPGLFGSGTPGGRVQANIGVVLLRAEEALSQTLAANVDIAAMFAAVNRSRRSGSSNAFSPQPGSWGRKVQPRKARRPHTSARPVAGRGREIGN
jgi:hypothetical protein